MIRNMMPFALAMVLGPIAHPMAEAGFIVSVGDLTLDPGGTGLIDVTIESDASDLLNFFGFEFRISGSSSLQFAETQPNPSADSNYVFFGNSDSYFADVSSNGSPNDTLIGGDGTADFSDVVISSEKLLARLSVEHLLPPGAVTSGETFTIELLSSPNTFFEDSEFNRGVFSSNSGTVTIRPSQASPVPEPSALYLLAAGIGSLCIFGCFRQTFRLQEQP